MTNQSSSTVKHSLISIIIILIGIPTMIYGIQFFGDNIRRTPSDELNAITFFLGVLWLFLSALPFAIGLTMIIIGTTLIQDLSKRAKTITISIVSLVTVVAAIMWVTRPVPLEINEAAGNCTRQRRYPSPGRHPPVRLCPAHADRHQPAVLRHGAHAERRRVRHPALCR